MTGKTFVEKIFDAPKSSIVFKKTDIVLSHDNTVSIEKTFEKMGGDKVRYPDQILNVLDHNAPPTNAKLANDYQQIRRFVQLQSIDKFYDVGNGICHQIMSYHASPGMVIVGSDSHTCTAGAFNAFAAGVDRTETAGIWKHGETWFRVPETIKIILHGKLNDGVFAKDIALWIIGMLGSSGADYMSIEYHGDGVKTLSISERMTITNLASEMGAKNAVFPPDEMLETFLGEPIKNGVWADDDAVYFKEIELNLGEGKHVTDGFQLLVIPASKKIYLQAMKEGIIATLMESGANILTPSCGPCLGTGQGIPADNCNVISTANRNF
ncbi:MAG: hypothetical protein B6242_05735, partial [Anaerolineaceae bacterium 4572_78]